MAAEPAVRHRATAYRGPFTLALTSLLAASVLTACGGAGDTARTPGAGPPGTTGGASGGADGTPSMSGGGPAAPTTCPRTPTQRPTPTPRHPVPHRIRTAVYFLHGEHVSPAPRSVSSPRTAAEAVRALLAGPSAYERGQGRSTAIPSGTVLRSLVVRAGTATVDLSGRYDDGGGSLSMSARLAQVVFTATRFPSIDKVAFRIDGKAVASFGGEGIVLNRPVGRADFEEIAPAVLVESPLIGEKARSPLRVWGSANTFEAVFKLRVTDAAGRTAADVRVTATSGTGTRGTFDVTVPYDATRSGPGRLIAYYLSAKDGGEVVVDTVPIGLTR